MGGDKVREENNVRDEVVYVGFGVHAPEVGYRPEDLPEGIEIELAGLPSVPMNLADKYDAHVFIDECHATGFLGATGGYTTGPKEVISLLRQRARPYLFSNTVAPAVVRGSAPTRAPACAVHHTCPRTGRRVLHRV